MEDKENVSTSPVKSESGSVSPTKKGAQKSKTAKTTPKGGSKSSHPPTSEMVNAAIRELKDRKGSSLQAIKKYIGSTYKVDGEKLAPFIKRYLKSAVTSGAVVQTKGKGASGSFKLSVSKGTESKTKVQRAVKVAEPKKPKKSVEKKTTAARKPAVAKSPAKKAEAAKKPAAKKSPAKTEKPAKPEKKSPSETTKAISKSKKTAKAPAAKTKTPKPKKTAASKAVKSAAKK
ncbi:histone H1-I [Halictus rubicundus]|uniref:histone H1-I n=1 Tax=Halictus rubicundus TaxID=77578 RepID=UPI0040360425